MKFRRRAQIAKGPLDLVPVLNVFVLLIFFFLTGFAFAADIFAAVLPLGRPGPRFACGVLGAAFGLFFLPGGRPPFFAGFGVSAIVSLAPFRPRRTVTSDRR